MAISTYNFVGINNPSATHKAYEGANESLPGTTDGAELTSVNYDKAESSNDVRHSAEAEEPEYAFTRFEFKIAEAAGDITQIKGKHEGYAWGANGETDYGLQLYIRNFTSGEWELLNSHTNNGDQAIEGVKTESIAHYLNGSNYVFLLAWQTADPDDYFEGAVLTDYVECEITYEEGGEEQFAVRFNPFGVRRFGGF